MRLIPQPVLASLPRLDADLPGDPVAHVRLTHALGATWHMIAASPYPDGDWLLLVHVDLGEPEIGFATLRELEDVDVDGVHVERDPSFVPARLSMLGAAARQPVVSGRAGP